ncbi:MAG: hypothetical protein V1769_05650 [Thermoplasmatota archaeon]
MDNARYSFDQKQLGELLLSPEDLSRNPVAEALVSDTIKSCGLFFLYVESVLQMSTMKHWIV